MVTKSRVMPKVLVVDDEPDAVELIDFNLKAAGYEVVIAADGNEALKKARSSLPDLIVLDLMLPEVDGLEVCKILRRDPATAAIPIIMVTAKAGEIDRVLGLELGADDYITKPFSPRELLARIRAVLRRYQTARDLMPARDEGRRAYRFAGWELNLLTRRLVAPDGRRVEITNGEFSLLQALCAAPQRVLSRDQLLELSRLHGAEVYDRSIDVQILRLRRKIEANPSEPEFIKTERGAGYMFSVPVEILG